MYSFDEAKKIFNSLYSDIDGHYISTDARKKHGLVDKTLTYGEITPETFYVILNKLKPQTGEVFYDLGCGTGKAVIFAALSENFSKLVGIDILKELCDAADKVLGRLRERVQNTAEIKFINGDFLELNISDADIVFAHSTCFSEEAMKKLQKKLAVLKKGARVITVTKTIDAPYFKLIESKEYPFTWGIGTVNFYEKI